LPLDADDFDASDVATSEALDTERRLYPIPLPPPDLMTTSEGIEQAGTQSFKKDLATDGDSGSKAVKSNHQQWIPVKHPIT